MEKILSKWEGKKVVYLTEDEIRKNIYYIVFAIVAVIILVAIILVVKLQRINHQLELKVIERTKELYEANERLKEMSMIDEITNISNRRCFDGVFKKTWKISLRKEQPLSLILLDVDYFKEYNDTYGHLAGDYCLKIIAKILKTSVKRSGDLVARFGGEEFIIMLSDTPEEGAMIIAEKIRSTIEKRTIICEDKETSVTVSLGTATMIPRKNLDPMHLIRLADKAMYKAKENGRNKVMASNAVDQSDETDKALIV